MVVAELVLFGVEVFRGKIGWVGKVGKIGGMEVSLGVGIETRFPSTAGIKPEEAVEVGRGQCSREAFSSEELRGSTCLG